MGIKTTHKGYGGGRGDDPHGVTQGQFLLSLAGRSNHPQDMAMRERALQMAKETHPSNRKK